MSKFKLWIHSFRLRTLPLALSTTLTGSITAYSANKFQWTVFVLASLTALFLQILSNLANDYGDAVSGVDKIRKGPLRVVQSGLITKKEMTYMILVFILLSLTTGILLIYISFPSLLNIKSIIFFILGLGAIAAAINYTIGNNPYGYKGWGDLFVLLFFGIIGSGGTYYLHTKNITITSLLPAFFIGFFSVGVLNINNLRDEESDRESNKKSLVVIFGKRFGIIYHDILIIVGYLALILYNIFSSDGHMKWFFLILSPLIIIHLRNVNLSKSNESMNNELKRLAITTFLTTILWGLGIIVF